MRFGSTAKILAKCKLKYYRIPECGRRSLLEVETKGDDSPVTVADREAEEAIRQVLRTNCPDHAILGEESGFDWPGQSGHAEYLWVIDPIDGTKSFITGSESQLLAGGFVHRLVMVIAL